MGAPVSSDTRPDSVLIVDDHRAFAEAVAMAISAQPDLRCLELASTGAEALDRVNEERPDVVLLDVVLPDADGVEVLPQIRGLAPEARILLITGAATPDLVIRAAESGADALLHKENALAAVIDAVRNPDGLRPADPSTLRVLRNEVLPSTPADGGVEHGDLTRRELEVLQLLAEGLPVKIIARRLDISVNTCRGYVRGVLEKLAAHSQLEAVVKAIRLGLLPELRQ